MGRERGRVRGRGRKRKGEERFWSAFRTSTLPRRGLNCTPKKKSAAPFRSGAEATTRCTSSPRAALSRSSFWSMVRQRKDGSLAPLVRKNTLTEAITPHAFATPQHGHMWRAANEAPPPCTDISTNKKYRTPSVRIFCWDN